MPKRRESYRIDIRDQRLPEGRFTCSARTTSAPEFRKREAAIRSLIDLAAWDVLERITAKGKGKLHVAEVAAAVQRGDIDSIRAARSEPMTLGRTADRLRRQKEATRRAGTQRQVEVVLKQLEAFFGVERDKAGRILRDVELATVTRQQCQDFLHDQASAWAPRTQGVKHAYAKQVWQLAIHEEAESAERENRKPRLRRNPWDQVEPAEIVATRVIFLRAEERDALLAKLTDTPLSAFMAVAYHAGLRLGETVNLRTSIDVDLEKGVLHIQSRPGEYAWLSKTGRNRDVPINQTLRAFLERHLELGFAGGRYFFHAPRHDLPLGSATAYAWWVEAYKAAGIKHGRSEIDAVVYHTGRHSFASLLVQQGVSPLVVAELIGDSYEEVIRTYGHLTNRNLSDAVQLLEPKGVSAKTSTEKTAGRRKTA